VRTVRTVDEIRALSRSWKREGTRVGFVPTMGALHEGHLSLVRLVRSRCDRTVVSIFVNPLQFGPGEDFDRYPRDLDRDRSLCEGAGVDAVWAPSPADLYPEGFATAVEVEGPLATSLCGGSRPGHFRGVATVVAKLLLAVEPDVAVFGQKDAQQVAVIRRMAADLALPCEIAVAPTVREPDGLALSSRNAYLTPAERSQATCLKRGLDAASALFAAGQREPRHLLGACRAALESSPLARIDYLALVDAATLVPVEPTLSRPALLAVAVFFGRTRLIDNALLSPSE